MRNFCSRIVILLAMVVFPLHLTLGQQKESQKDLKKDSVSPLIRSHLLRDADQTTKQALQRKILDEIQSGISKGDAALLARHLGSQVYISLRGSEGGYYSANQAFYVLQNFFSLNRPASFAFSTYGEIDETPYATGRGYLSRRGVRESVQIYVSLTQHEGRWVLAEFNVY